MPELYADAFLGIIVATFGLLFAGGKVLDGVPLGLLKLWGSLVMAAAASVTAYPILKPAPELNAPFYVIHWILTLFFAILMGVTLAVLHVEVHAHQAPKIDEGGGGG